MKVVTTTRKKVENQEKLEMKRRAESLVMRKKAGSLVKRRRVELLPMAKL